MVKSESIDILTIVTLAVEILLLSFLQAGISVFIIQEPPSWISDFRFLTVMAMFLGFSCPTKPLTMMYDRAGKQSYNRWNRIAIQTGS